MKTESKRWIRSVGYCFLLMFTHFALAKPEPTAPPQISPSATVERALKHANDGKYSQADALAIPLTSALPKGSATKGMWDYYTRTQTVVQISVTNEVFKWQNESGGSGLFGNSQIGTAGVDLTLTYKGGDQYLATVMLLKISEGPWQILRIGNRVALTNFTDSALPPPAAQTTAQGKRLEIHRESGRPDVAIYMTGFLDSSFHAYLDGGDAAELVFRNLPCMREDFKFTTNSIVRKTTAKRIANTPALQMYEVFWSGDGNRFAVAFCGYFIAAYDRSTKQRLQYSPTDPRQHRAYRAFDEGVARFLKGEEISEETIEEIRKASPNTVNEGAR